MYIFYKYSSLSPYNSVSMETKNLFSVFFNTIYTNNSKYNNLFARREPSFHEQHKSSMLKPSRVDAQQDSPDYCIASLMSERLISVSCSAVTFT